MWDIVYESCMIISFPLVLFFLFFEACDVRNAGLGYDTTRKKW